MPLWILPTLLCPFALSAAGVFCGMRIATRLGVLDLPALLKQNHASPTPLWGGVVPFLVFIFVASCVELVTHFFSQGTFSSGTFWGLCGALFVLLFGGMWDDVRSLPPKFSFLFPVLGAFVAIGMGMGVSRVTNPFGDPFVITASLSAVITFTWLLCVTYTTKLLDGVDGLVSGVGMVGAFMIAALALTERWYQPDIALLALLFFVVLLGFFLWNVAPAKVFLGEAGSTAIGFTLGALSIMGGSKFATLLLVVGLPALDVAFVMIRRIRAGRSPFHGGDGLHFHTVLQRSGWSARKIVALYMVTAFLFGVTTLLLSSWQKLLVLIILGILALFGMIFFSRKMHL